MGRIKIALVGVGNCASALVQGIEYYRRNPSNGQAELLGLMHYQLGGYGPEEIEVVAAFDIDQRKVGRPLHEAIFAPPNCTQIFQAEMPPSRVRVSMGRVLDGFSEHMKGYSADRTFLVADEASCDVEEVLRRSEAEMLLNYLPVGSEEAARFYATCCLSTGISFINCMPTFIVSDSKWEKRFKEKGIPVIGDDIKAQLGATILHRALAKLFTDRGIKIDRTYQLNTGGNTDFLNMLNQDRLKSKRISKTDAVQSQLPVPLESDNIYSGPSDYVPWQKDNKICFLRIEGRGFGGVPIHLELRLSVEDSPNSGGVSIDAIRCCKLARERGVAGALLPASAYLMKHPPRQMPDHEARRLLEEFIAGGDRQPVFAPS
ncbi:MAG: inositol-3-phosphate synthase [Candidatus Tectomicrobia bacterium]|uniref:Inositol-3-phosphate synthase n=1 Tax=Tectimicrobiota bacterium TaxID=2528274 RepID=A0A932CLH4_UNCTE|nr:inositol-3-phosphate synthase [Candidatus Tectomicrobia bacterium]